MKTLESIWNDTSYIPDFKQNISIINSSNFIIDYNLEKLGTSWIEFIRDYNVVKWTYRLNDLSLEELLEIIPEYADMENCIYRYDEDRCFNSDYEPYNMDGYIVITKETFEDCPTMYTVDYDYHGFLGYLPQATTLKEALLLTIKLLIINGYLEKSE